MPRRRTTPSRRRLRRAFLFKCLSPRPRNLQLRRNPSPLDDGLYFGARTSVMRTVFLEALSRLGGLASSPSLERGPLGWLGRVSIANAATAVWSLSQPARRRGLCIGEPHSGITSFCAGSFVLADSFPRLSCVPRRIYSLPFNVRRLSLLRLLRVYIIRPLPNRPPPRLNSDVYSSNFFFFFSQSLPRSNACDSRVYRLLCDMIVCERNTANR